MRSNQKCIYSLTHEISGGHPPPPADFLLSLMNQAVLPWKLTYSYGRALQQAALKAWSGKTENVPAAQAAFYNRAKLNSLAALGKYEPALEKVAA